MTLRELYEKADRASYFSRTEADIFDALNHAALKIYLRVVKEMKGFFLKWDESSLVFHANTDSYALPPDLNQIVNLGERPVGSTSRYRKISPVELNTLAYALPGADADWMWNTAASIFSYYGPYLPAAPTISASPPPQTLPVQQAEQEVMWLRIQPAPTDDRQTRICYTAKYVQITNELSPLMMPGEGHEALLAFAIAELTRRNSDALSAEYESRGERDTTDFLAGYVRPRQIDEGPYVTPYIFDMD